MGAMAIRDAAESLAQKSPSGLEYCAISAAKVPAFAAVRVRLPKCLIPTQNQAQQTGRGDRADGEWQQDHAGLLPQGRAVMRAASRISFGISLNPA